MTRLDLNVLDKVLESDNYITVEFKGALDKSNIKDVREVIANFIEGFKDQYLIFDLKYFDFVNSEGVGFFVSMFYKMESMGKVLHIVNAQPQVKDVFDVVGLSQIIEVYDSIEEIVKNIK
jgi:anti-sigma B factor antagonist